MNVLSQITRRAFLAGGTACALVGAVPRTRKHSAYESVKIGKTGIVTTRLGFGTGVSAWNKSSAILRKWGKIKAAKLIRTAYERGVRFFDLADAYGTHLLVRDALKGVPRESYVLATKYAWQGGIPQSERADVLTSIDRYLKELETDYIDIVQIHCLTDPAWPTKMSAHIKDLDKAKRAGKIRAHGCSFHSLGALKAAVETSWLDVAHARINPYGKKMSVPSSKVMPILRKLHAQGKGVIGMKILGEGALSKDSAKIDASIAYALNSGVVDVLNIGFLNIAEVDDIANRIARVSVKKDES